MSPPRPGIGRVAEEMPRTLDARVSGVPAVQCSQPAAHCTCPDWTWHAVCVHVPRLASVCGAYDCFPPSAALLTPSTQAYSLPRPHVYRPHMPCAPCSATACASPTTAQNSFTWNQAARSAASASRWVLMISAGGGWGSSPQLAGAALAAQLGGQRHGACRQLGVAAAGALCWLQQECGRRPALHQPSCVPPALRASASKCAQTRKRHLASPQLPTPRSAPSRTRLTVSPRGGAAAGRVSCATTGAASRWVSWRGAWATATVLGWVQWWLLGVLPVGQAHTLWVLGVLVGRHTRFFSSCCSAQAPAGSPAN